MISNMNLIKAFINGMCAQNGSMYTNGKKLYSYATCIAEKTADGKILFNVSKYSPTTSKQQSYTRRALEAARKEFVEVGKDKHIPMGTDYLAYYLKAA